MGSGATTTTNDSSTSSSGAPSSPAGATHHPHHPQHHHHHHRRTTITTTPARTFAIGSYRFQCSRRRLMDAILDCVSFCVEGFVYLIGPALIVLALSIIALLTITFFRILLPMMNGKHAGNPYRTLLLMAHSAWVIFVVANVLFNYASCVLQKHTGRQYDQVVAELAEATEFPLPQTPEELAVFRRELQDRLVIRMRRRNGRTTTAAENNSNGGSSAESAQHLIRRNGAASPARQRKGDGSTSPSAAAASAAAATSNAAPSSLDNTTAASGASSSSNNGAAAPKGVRSWMLMGPFEWGYCANSNRPKPPRSHFDHVSKTLVLNLDHYCPWMFNAIGYFNYRYFVNFLIYIFLGMAYGTSIMLEPFLLTKSPEYRQQLALQRNAKNAGIVAAVERMRPMMPLREEKMLLTLSFMLCAAVGIAVLLLGGFHIYLTVTAQTTIEFHGNIVARKKARAVGQKWKNPYSRGSWRGNWQQVYGTQYRWLLLSLLPSRREPEFLPVPVPGHDGRRSRIIAAANGHKEESDNNNIPCDVNTSYPSEGLKTVNLV